MCSSDLLVNYNGTILIVSHDRRFIENMANDLLIIEDKNIKHFQGKYNEYLESKNKLKLDIEEKEIDEKKMLLKTEISALIGEISLEKNEEKKTELDMMYQEKLEELKELNKM